MRRRALATGLLSSFAALILAVIAGTFGTQAPSFAAQQTPDPGRTPPTFTLPPQFSLPPEFTVPPESPVATLPPTPPPTPSAVPTTAPVPTGPAVGTEVTPPALANVQLAQVGPTPQQSGSDVTLVILIVIVGLALLAIGAFVLAIAVQ
ncbi:MAG: hypothetical protein JOZ75_00215 [Candidatus Dormibacteraeota bacterium]|nr:hypothetical protein [Candidatus Dormibacteraeota bacterium]